MTQESGPHDHSPAAARRFVRDLGAAAGVAALTSSLFGMQPAQAAGTARLGSFALVNLADGDQVYNYDFDDQNAVRNNVDWPLNLFFYNDAEIDRVKNILQPQFDNTGGIQDARLRDGTALTWDTDRGMKNPQPSCSGGNTDIHMRVYADGDDRMYNTTDGYYVFATSHKDINEGCTGEEFGYSEAAEGGFATEYSNRGYFVAQDDIGFGNWEPPRHETSSRYWDNDGNATAIYIP